MPIFTTVADIRASAAKLGLSATSSGVSTQIEPTGPSDEVFELGKTAGNSDLEAQTLPAELRAETLDGEVQISAADYNPDDDRKLDDQRRKDHDTKIGIAAPQTAVSQKEIADGVGEPKPPVIVEDDEYEEVEEDIEDDDFDMFAVDDAPKKKRKVLRKKTVSHLRSSIRRIGLVSSASKAIRQDHGCPRACSGYSCG